MIKKFIVFVSLTLFLGVVSEGHLAWSQSLEGAIKDYQNGKFNKAERQWQTLAEAGDADALFNLGQMYHLGDGAAFDDKKAVDYFLAAASMGHTAAARELGNLYFFSPRVNGGKQAAVNWWLKAAQAGDGQAQYLLGILYFNGDGVEQSRPHGFAWTLLAVDAGVNEAIQSQTAMRGQLSETEFTTGNALAQTLMTASPSQGPAHLLIGEAPQATRSILVVTKTATIQLPRPEPEPVTLEEIPVLEIEEMPTVEEKTEDPQVAVEATIEEEVTNNEKPLPKPTEEPAIEQPAIEEQAAKEEPDNFTETREALNGLIDETTPAIEVLNPDDTYDLGDPLSPLVTEENFSPDWSVQLASFRKPENAETQWQDLSQRFPDLFAGLERRIVRYDLGADRGVYYRLRIGPYADKPAADLKCLEIKEAGLDCLVIWP